MNSRRVAIHEAGHAVAAFELCRRVRLVTIVPTEDYYGLCCFGSNGRDELHGSSLNDRLRLKLEREVMIDFAGVVAEKLLIGRYPRGWRRSHDLHHADLLCVWVTRDARTRQAYVHWLWWRTHEFMDDEYRQAAIIAVADALLQHGTLGGRRAREIYNEAILPTF